MSRKKVAELYCSEDRYDIFEGVNLIGSNKHLVTVYLENPGISEVQAAIIVNGSEHYFSNLNSLNISKLNDSSVTPFICNSLKSKMSLSIGNCNFIYFIISDRSEPTDFRNSSINSFINVPNNTFDKSNFFEDDDDDDFIPSTQFIFEAVTDNINTAIEETWIDEMDVSDLELSKLEFHTEKKITIENDTGKTEILEQQKNNSPCLNNMSNLENVEGTTFDNKKWLFEEETEWIEGLHKIDNSIKYSSEDNYINTNEITKDLTQDINNLETQLINTDLYKINDKNIEKQEVHQAKDCSKLSLDLETQFDLNIQNSDMKVLENGSDFNKENKGKSFSESETQFDLKVIESLYEKIYRGSMAEYSQEIGTKVSVIGKKHPVIDSDSEDSLNTIRLIGKLKKNSTDGWVQINESSDDDLFADEIKAGNDFQINTLDLLEAGPSGVNKETQNDCNSSSKINDSSIQIFEASTQLIDLDSIESPKNPENISKFDTYTKEKSIFDTPIGVKKGGSYLQHCLNNNLKKQCLIPSKSDAKDIYDIATQVIDKNIDSIKSEIKSNSFNEKQFKSIISFQQKSIFDTPTVNNDLNKSFAIFNASTQLSDDLVGTGPKEEKVLRANFQDETPRFDSPANISIIEHNELEPKEIKSFIYDEPTQIVCEEVEIKRKSIQQSTIVLTDATKENIIDTKTNSIPKFKPKLLFGDEDIDNDEIIFQRPKAKGICFTKTSIGNNQATTEVNILDNDDSLTQFIGIPENSLNKNVHSGTYKERIFEKDKKQNICNSEEILTQLIEEKTALGQENDDMENILTQVIEENHESNNCLEKSVPQTLEVKVNQKKKKIDLGQTFIQIIDNGGTSANCDFPDENLTQYIDETFGSRQNSTKKSKDLEQNIGTVNLEDVLTQLIDDNDAKRQNLTKAEDSTHKIPNNKVDIYYENLTQLTDERITRQNLSLSYDDTLNEDLTQLIDIEDVKKQNLNNLNEDSTQIIEDNSEKLFVKLNKGNINTTNISTATNKRTSKQEKSNKNSLNSIENFPVVVLNPPPKKETIKRSSTTKETNNLPKKNVKLSSKKLQNENNHSYNTRSRSKK